MSTPFDGPDPAGRPEPAATSDSVLPHGDPWTIPGARAAAPSEPAGHPPAPEAGFPLPPPGAVPPAEAPSSRAALLSRARVRGGLAVAAAVLLGAGAGAGVTATVMHGHGATSAAQALPGSRLPIGTGSGSAGGMGSSGGTDDGTTPFGQLPEGFPGFPDDQSRLGTSSSVKASSVQSVGVVDIDTVDGYQGAEAAGTGLVVTSSGEIVTNNHVIEGATRIKVTVVSTGRTYSARVVGTSPTNDIAVLQLTGASGLTTANFGDSSSVKVGASVTGVGNAGGTGGTPSAARGTVTALHRTITASGDSAASEKLTDMIVVNAPIVSGDSGGPLYDADNKVVGIDTAAATSVGISRGYAIPIDRALAIASRIESGKASATIHIGYPAFLGVGLSSGSGRPTVAQVFSGSPAAKAGLAAGDVVTAVDGHPVSDYAKLHHLLITRSPGETVNITYTDTSGASRTVKVTLTTGPAD